MDISWVLMACLLSLTALSVGSFLNVVIHRLPRILEHEWTRQCRQWLPENTAPEKATSHDNPPYNLFFPASHCPQCKHTLRLKHNVPLLSFCFLKGRCAFCHNAISWQYPLVEFITLLLFMLCYAMVGLTSPLLPLLLFTSLLIPLCIIDLRKQLLPDLLTYGLLWCGLLTSCFSLFVDPTSAIFGATAGYGVFWLTANLFKRITHREGLGYGDCKLLAALGAWVGWQGLTWVILTASLSGIVVVVFLMALKRHKVTQPIPFGPFLAASGWLTLAHFSWIQRGFQGWLS